MSIDVILLNLRILGKIPPGGRITRSSNGVITMEPSSLFLSIKRWVLSDGRHQSVAEIQRILVDAGDKCSSLLNSRFMVSDVTTEEHRAVREDLQSLFTALVDSTIGIRNLRTTYCKDACTLAQIEMILAKIDALLSKIRNYTDIEYRAEVASETSASNNLAQD